MHENPHEKEFGRGKEQNDGSWGKFHEMSINIVSIWVIFAEYATLMFGQCLSTHWVALSRAVKTKRGGDQIGLAGYMYFIG